MKVSQVLRGLGLRATPPAVPKGGLLASQGQRDRWQAWLAEAGGADVLARHPRAAKLAQGFAVGSYLAANPDVADAVSNPAEAVFHYLEFGLPEGRSGMADRWDADFVARLGHPIPAHLTAPRAAAALSARGVAAADIVLCERDLWLTLGLHGPALERLFHPECYRAALDARGMDMPPPDRLACIRHFAQTGLDAGLPAHPDHELDTAFYRASLADLGLPAPDGAGALPRHWARIGLRAGAHANARAWVVAHAGLQIPDAILPALPAASAASLTALLERPAAHRLDATDPDLRRLVVALARFKRRQGDAAEAEALLSQALAAAPDDAAAAVALADLIHGRGQTDREAALRRIAPPEFDSGANRVTLAELELASGRIDTALDLAGRLPSAARGDVTLRRRARAVGRAAFDRLWSGLAAAIDRHGVAGVQRLLERALTLHAPTPDRIARAAPIRRVAILANDDIYQCKLYRADQKADQLRAAGLDVRIFLQSRDVATLHGALDRFDAVIFQRSPAFPDIADLMLDAAGQGLATFYDIDDLVFDPAHFPPPLETYAGQIDAARHAEIACGVPLFAAAARLCDVGIASTPPIREALAPLTRSGTAILHRNALGAAHLGAMAAAAAEPAAPDADRLVLFYGSGTRAHKAEFHDILEPALARVLADRPGRVAVHLMGEFGELAHLDPAHPDLHLLPPVWDFETYAGALAGADVALSVLAASASADAKSELKWTEPAMFGIPAVVSPTSVMSEVIEDGVTGFLAADAEAFHRALLKLVDDPGLRRKVGAAARDVVLRDYALPAMGQALVRGLASARAPTAPARRRLLMVNVFYPPQDIGGATRVVADNVRHLLDHHGDTFEIDVITTLEGGSRAHEVQTVSHGGARVWAITAADGVREQAMHDPVMDNRIAGLIDRIDPDLVHVHCVQRMGVGVIDLCRHRGLPYLVTLHDGWWASPHQFITGPDGAAELYDLHAGAIAAQPERARIARRCLTGAATVLAVSESFAQLHRDIGLADVRALPNGVSDLPVREAQPGPPGRVRLGLIGGAARHKGFDILRAALTARAHANLDLLVVDHALPPGTEVGEEWNTTPVRRIPRQPQSRIGALFGAFDVLLAPSIWPESFGLVAREALALGLWVVCSDRGAIGADITEDANGHLVDVSDHRALADVLARIDADPHRYTQSPALRPTLRRSREQAEDLARIYREILDGR